MKVPSKSLRLSVSAIKTYQQCPRKYFYNYIEKLPKKKWPHTELGNFVHDCLEDFHNILINQQTTPEEWPGIMNRVWKKLKSKYELTAEQLMSAHKMIKRYLDVLKDGRRLKVLANEKAFNIKIDEALSLTGYIDRLDIEDETYHIVDYKGLALDTPIPSPDGWTTMGDLKVGDRVFGSDGCPTKVVAKSGIHNRPCYKISFNDDTSIICDNVHLWPISFRSVAKIDSYQSTLSTEDLYKAFIESDVAGRFFIANPESLQYEQVDLSANPWRAGLFLGDEQDQSIPASYLRSSVEQRLGLLRGFMDVRGSWNVQKKRCEFTTYSTELSDQLLELIRSLGVSARSIIVINKNGQISRRIEFCPIKFNPFEMFENADLYAEAICDAAELSKFDSFHRQIIDVEKIDSVPTQCISVDAEDSLYVCGRGMCLSHNTGKSKYLDEFQLLVYGMAILEENPNVEKLKAAYIMLSEDCKEIAYTFTKTDIKRCVAKVIDVAEQIRSDQTWEPKPQFLCNYCDFKDACPANAGWATKQLKA